MGGQIFGKIANVICEWSLSGLHTFSGTRWSIWRWSSWHGSFENKTWSWNLTYNACLFVHCFFITKCKLCQTEGCFLEVTLLLLWTNSEMKMIEIELSERARIQAIKGSKGIPKVKRNLSWLYISCCISLVIFMLQVADTLTFQRNFCNENILVLLINYI